jgi:hypothetical protein
MLSRFKEWRRYRRMRRENHRANRGGRGVDPSEMQARVRKHRSGSGAPDGVQGQSQNPVGGGGI